MNMNINETNLGGEPRRDQECAGVGVGQAQMASQVEGCARVRGPIIHRSVLIETDEGFPHVLRVLSQDPQAKAMRAGWNGPGQWVAAQFPDKMSKMGAPYLYLYNSQGVCMPWVPSQGDLFARDWVMLPYNDAENRRP